MNIVEYLCNCFKFLVQLLNIIVRISRFYLIHILLNMYEYVYYKYNTIEICTEILGVYLSIIIKIKNTEKLEIPHQTFIYFNDLIASLLKNNALHYTPDF